MTYSSKAWARDDRMQSWKVMSLGPRRGLNFVLVASTFYLGSLNPKP